jgi:hypothetical protein
MSGARVTYHRAIVAWPFTEAPAELRQLVRRPGTWIVVVPGDAPMPAWCETSPEFRHTERRGLSDGDTCYIGFAEERV